MNRYSKLQPLSGNFPPIGCDFAIWQSRSTRVDLPELTSPVYIHVREREGIGTSIISYTEKKRGKGKDGGKVEWIER